MRASTTTLLMCLLCCGAWAARAAVIPSDPLPPRAAPDPALDAAIPPDDPAAYAGVLDAADWSNPYLIVRADGVEIRSDGTIRVVAADAVAEALAALPVSAWPYGRVVAIQEQSIRSGNDGEAIALHRGICEAELRRLGVTASWWPSA